MVLVLRLLFILPGKKILFVLVIKHFKEDVNTMNLRGFYFYFLIFISYDETADPYNNIKVLRMSNARGEFCLVN